MSFSDILGQRAAAERFLATLQSGRMAHAYIVCGPDGVGKGRFAAEMAKAILCRQPAKSGEACGRCSSCLKMERGSHPEVALLERRPERQDILVEQVEELREAWFALRPVEGSRKVCIVREADRMNDEVANRLLKILEEPAGETVFILTTSRPEALLETILSRCQTVRLRRVGENEIVEHLKALRSELSAEEAALAARLAEGSPGRAAELIEGDLLQRTRWAVGLVSRLTPDNLTEVMGELMSYTARKGREKLEDARRRFALILDALMLHWKDQLLGQQLGESSGRRGLLGDSSPLEAWQLEALLEVLLQAEQRLLANVNLTALAQTMLTKMASILVPSGSTASR